MKDRVFARFAVILALGLSLTTLTPAIAPALADTPAVAEEPAQDVLARWQADPTALFAAAEIDPRDLAYQARILVVFAEAEAQPQFTDQIALITARIGELAARDVIVVLDADPDGRSALRQQLRPRGFSLVMLDKDGTIVFRKPDPWDVREISRQIDKLPSRRQEVRG